MKKIKQIKTKLRLLTITLSLISLLLLSSCGGNRATPLKVYTGTEGVTINFPKNVPPEKIFENQSFLVVAELWNKGAYSFNESTGDYGVVGITYDPLYFTSASANSFSGAILKYEDLPQFMVAGKGYDWPNGERLNKEVAFLKVNEIPGTRESPTVELGISVCYPYQTILSKEVCIDVDTYDADNNPVCTNPGTYSFSGGQGAPIAITKIEADMIPANMEEVQPTFRFTIKNMQQGVVFTRDPYYAPVDNICSPTALTSPRGRDDINSLKVEVWLGGDNEQSKLKCTPNPVRIYDGDAEVTCFMQGTTKGHNRNYVSLLTIKTNYVYRSQTKEKVRIVRLI